MRYYRRKRILSITALIIVLVFVVCFFLPLIYPKAQTVDDLNKQYKDLQGQLNDLQKNKSALSSQISGNKASQQQAAAQKQSIDSSISLTQKQIDILRTQISDNQQRINRVQTDIDKTQKEIDSDNKLYRQRICALYEVGDVSYIQLLLSSKDISDFLNRYEIIRKISQHDNGLLDRLQVSKQQKKKLSDTLQAEKATLKVKETALNSKQQSLNSQAVQSADLINQLQKSGTALDSQTKTLNQKSEQLEDNMQAANQEIQNLLRQNQIRSQSQNESKNQSQNQSQSQQQNQNQNPVPFTGKFIWPIRGVGYISCVFNGYPGHTGCDNAAPPHTPIYAAASGTVVAVGHWDKSVPRTQAGYGNYVLIDHGGGLATLYAHCFDGSIAVTVGQQVSQGQHIADVGNSGNVRSGGGSPPISDTVTAAHLHFEIRVNGQPVDPYIYVRP